MADGFDIDSTTSWEPCSGWALFALVLVIFSGCTLIDSDDNTSFYGRLTRISPLSSMYDIFHRLVEIGFLVYERYIGGGEDDQEVDVYVQLARISNYTTLNVTLHLTALASFLALMTFRNATGTQLIATLYFARWLTHCIVPIPPIQTQHPDRTETIHRATAAFFAMFWHWLVHTTMVPASCQTGRTEAANAGIAFLSTGMAYVLASPTENDNHSVFALGMQMCCICFVSLAWLFVLSPLAMLRATPTPEMPEAQVMERWLLPAMWMGFGVLSFLFSRHSLEVARKGVKVMATGMWVGVMGFYYCYWYPFLSRAASTPTAERPNVMELVGAWLREDQHGL